MDEEHISVEADNEDDQSELDVDAIQDPASPPPSYTPTSPGRQSNASGRDVDGPLGGEDAASTPRGEPATQADDEGNRDPRTDTQQTGGEPPPSIFQMLRRISSSSHTNDQDDATLVNLMNELNVHAQEIFNLINEDKVMLREILMGVDITEVYSRPRVVQMGMSMGLIGGDSFDIRTGWDLSVKQNQARVFQMIQASDPTMVIGSPPCTKFSIIQNLNRFLHRDDPMWLQRFEEEVERAKEHLRFCAKIYRFQLARGKYFLHEHPKTATSWSLDEIAQLERHNEVLKIECHQCEFGLTTTVGCETLPAKKQTDILTRFLLQPA